MPGTARPSSVPHRRATPGGGRASVGRRITFHGRRAALVLLLVIPGGLFVLGPAPAAQGLGRAAEMERVLPRLAERAHAYRQTALRFACEEEVTLNNYDRQENIKKQDTMMHDYLLEYTEEGGLQPYRAILSRNGKPKERHAVKPNYGIPEPYGWQLLFSSGGHGRFDFRMIEQTYMEPFFTWVIEFKSALSFSEGTRIEEWEGTAWVDQDSLDILRVEARPAHEADTLEARLAVFRQAFRFLGIPTKSRPRARHLLVEFETQREGLRFPTRSLLTTRIVNDLEDQRLASSVMLRFRNYVFFDVESLDRFKALRSPDE